MCLRQLAVLPFGNQISLSAGGLSVWLLYGIAASLIYKNTLSSTFTKTVFFVAFIYLSAICWLRHCNFSSVLHPSLSCCSFVGLRVPHEESRLPSEHVDERILCVEEYLRFIFSILIESRLGPHDGIYTRLRKVSQCCVDDSPRLRFHPRPRPFISYRDL